MTENKFPVKLQLRIDWSELDLFEHVNNVTFFKYLQASRLNVLETIGLLKYHKETGIGPLLASLKCDFKKELHFPGQITVQARIDFIKNTSFAISHQIIDDENDLSAEAQDIIVLFDYKKRVKAHIPDIIRKQLEKLESK